MPAKMSALHLMLLGTASAFMAGPAPRTTYTASLRTVASLRSAPLVASAKIIPFAYAGLGGALLSRVAPASAPIDKAIYASAGLLSLCNLVVVDNARYASGKRAVAVYDGKSSLSGAALDQKSVAQLWYKLVQFHLVGQVASLVWMVRATSLAGVLRAATLFMATNVLLLLYGGDAKHDKDGLPTPIKPKVQRFVVTTDSAIAAATAVASIASPGSTIRSFGSVLFVVGCLIGAVEGVPTTLATLKTLAASE